MRTILACLLLLFLSVPAMAGTTTALGSGQYLTTVPKQCGGKLYCWGHAPVGDGTMTDRPAPTAIKPPSGSSGFKMVTTSAATCALDTQGKAFCWGYNTFGQMGNGTLQSTLQGATPLDFTPFPEPIAVNMPAGVPSFSSISTGASLINATTCALTPTGQAYCWGQDALGSVGNGINEGNGLFSKPQAVIMPDGVSFTFISAPSNGHTVCALGDDKRAYCWGSNGNGAMGINVVEKTITRHEVPEPVLFPKDITAFTELAVGGNTNCAIASNGKAYCWGMNSNGQIGDGTEITRYLPTEVVMPKGVSKFTSITNGGLYGWGGTTCAIADESDAYCWGDNSLGQIGNGTISEKAPLPTKVIKPKGVSAFKSITTAGYTVCAISNENQIYCWGADVYADVPPHVYMAGGKGLPYHNTPTHITLPNGVTGFSSISLRASGACAIAR